MDHVFIDVAFLLLWVSFPLCWLILFRFAKLKLLEPTIPSMTIAFIYLFQYIGLPILYFQLNAYRLSQGISDKFIVWKVFLFTSFTITFLIFGFIVAKQFFGALAWGEKNENKSKKITFNGWINEGVPRFSLYIIFFTCVSVLILYVLKVGIGNLALFHALGIADTNISIAKARSLMGNDFEGAYHWYYLFMNQLMIFIAYVFYAKYCLRSSFINKVVFMVAFIVVAFSLTMATEKAPLVLFLLGLFFIHTFVKSNGTISLRHVFITTIPIFVILIVFYIFFMNDSSIWAAISSVFSRAFTGSIQPAYHYLEFFPYNHDYLYGRSFPNPGGIFPFESYSLTTEIMAWRHPDAVEKGIVGSAPTIFWGEMYANFGFIGVLLAPLFVGGILYWLNYMIYRMRPSVVSIAFMVWMIMYFKDLSITSLSNYFINIYFITVVCVFILLEFLSGHGTLKIKSN